MRKQRPVHYVLFRFNRWCRRTLDNNFAFTAVAAAVMLFCIIYARNPW